MSVLFRRGIVPVLLLIALLWLVVPAEAHGYIVRSIPADRSTLERPPARLQYWFSEELEPEFSAILLRDDRGNVLAEGGVDPDDDTLLTLRVSQDLPDGAYIVELRPAFASDGHVIIESRVFFVGETVAGVEGQAASDLPRSLEILWKALLFNSTYLLFGTAVLYAYVFVPVWGSDKYPRGLLPPRLMTRLNRMMWAALIVAVLANIIALLQQTMIFFGTGLTQVIEGGLWNVVRIGSRFGDVWNFRMLVLLLVALMQAATLYFGNRYPRAVRSFWTANTYLLALLIGAQAVNSHAAGSLIMPWNALIIHWLHVIAVAFWVGGIAALALSLPVALAPYEGETRWQALRPVMNRFSRYVVGAVLVVITSGIYSAANWFYTPADLLTTYGAALGTKLMMIALLLFVGALHHIALRPHLLERVPFQGLVRWARNFGLSMRLETLLAILTLGAAALLSATPIPVPEFLQSDIETPTINQRVAEYDIQMTLAPAAPGINSLDVTVRRNILLVDDVSVAVQLVAPEKAERSAWLTAEAVDQGLYALVDDFIEESGYWLALVDIIEPDGRLIRAAFPWQISEDAGVIDSLPPSIVSLLAAFATLGAVIWVLTPALRRIAAQMNLALANVVIAIGVILMTVIALGASAYFLEQQAAQLERDLNPPPRIVNTVVPDAGSIAIGSTLLRSHCEELRAGEDFEALLQRLDFQRDDELFAITENGWRDLPSCDADLTTVQRWHIVNYLRTLRHTLD